MLPDDTRIAGQETVANWKTIRRRLGDCEDASLWTNAFERFFKARLDTRYLGPIRAIQEIGQKDSSSNGNQGEGFAILAIQCSIIEFLAATTKGINYRHSPICGGGDKLDKFEYSNPSKLFVSFLREEAPFSAMFTSNTQANNFYSCVRCSLLHEARTSGKWRVRSDGVKAIDTKLKVVDRNLLQDVGLLPVTGSMS